MYNKLFTQILDSSIWMEPTPTRIVWVTCIAAMDEDGFARFAAIGNLAHRARVTMEEAEIAVNCLEAPDQESSDQDNEGRRLERVPGGWLVLNASKYREIVSREECKRLNRERQARFKAKKKAGNAKVTAGNDSVTQSEAEANTETHSDGANGFEQFWKTYPKKKGKGAAKRVWNRLKPPLPELIEAVTRQKRWPEWTKEKGRFIPDPATWLNAERWLDEATTSTQTYSRHL